MSEKTWPLRDLVSLGPDRSEEQRLEAENLALRQLNAQLLAACEKAADVLDGELIEHTPLTDKQIAELDACMCLLQAIADAKETA